MSVNVSTLAQYGGQHGVHLLTPSSCALLHFIHLALLLLQLQLPSSSPGCSVPSPSLCPSPFHGLSARNLNRPHSCSRHSHIHIHMHTDSPNVQRGSRSRRDGSCSCSCMSDDCPLPLSLPLCLCLWCCCCCRCW